MNIFQKYKKQIKMNVSKKAIKILSICPRISLLKDDFKEE